MALRARSDAARRRSREKPIDAAGDPGVTTDLDGALADAELRALIDEELGRLPSTYRAAVVLCYLEGLTHEDAARQLGWPLGTVKGRLARARDLLRDRLTRRGVAAFSTAALASWFEAESMASVPLPWVESVVSVAKQISAGRATAGLVSVSAAALADGVLWAMTIQQAKTAAIAFGILGAIALSTGAFGRQPGGDQPAARGASTVQERKEGPSDGPLTTTNAPSAASDAVRGTEVAETPADELDQVAHQGFGIALQSFQAEVLDADKVYQWSKRIYDGETAPRNGSNRSPDVFLQAAEGHLKRMDSLVELAKAIHQSHGSGHPVLEYLNAQFYHRQAERMLADAERDQKRVALAANRISAELGSGAAGQFSRRHSRTTPAARGAVIVPDSIGPGEDAGKDPRSQAVIKKLDKALAMNFANETPLSDVLKHIRENTKSPDAPNGVAIYVDPIGLQEAEKTVNSTIELDLEGVPLRRTLQLALRQLGLVYWVEDGMIIITSESSTIEPWDPMALPIAVALNGDPIRRARRSLLRGESVS